MFYPGNTSTIFETSNSGSSSAIDAGLTTIWSMVFVWDGTPTGTVKVQVSPDTVTWTDLPGSSQNTSGSAGSHTVNYAGSGHRYLRASFTLSGGSGNLTVKWTGK